MAGFLTLITALTSLLGLVAKFFGARKERAEVRKELQGEVAVKELKVANAVNEVLAERRTDSDVANRLRDGKF